MKKLILLSVLFMAMSFNTQEVRRYGIYHYTHTDNNGVNQYIRLNLSQQGLNAHRNHDLDWEWIIVTPHFINN